MAPQEVGKNKFPSQETIHNKTYNATSRQWAPRDLLELFIM